MNEEFYKKVEESFKMKFEHVEVKLEEEFLTGFKQELDKFNRIRAKKGLEINKLYDFDSM